MLDDSKLTEELLDQAVIHVLQQAQTFAVLSDGKFIVHHSITNYFP